MLSVLSCGKQAVNNNLEKENIVLYKVAESYSFENIPYDSDCHFIDGKLYGLIYDIDENDQIKYSITVTDTEGDKETCDLPLENVRIGCWNFVGNDKNKITFFSDNGYEYDLIVYSLNDCEISTINVSDEIIKSDKISKICSDDANTFVLIGKAAIYCINNFGEVIYRCKTDKAVSIYPVLSQLVYYSSGCLYEYNCDSDSQTLIGDLSDSKIRDHNLSDLSKDNEIYYLSVRNKETYSVYGLSASKEKTLTDEKTELLIYEPGFSPIPQIFIDEFNFQSEKYHAVIDKDNREPAIRLLSDNAPDVLVLDSYSSSKLEDYAKQGYIIPLDQFIEKSAKIKRDDINSKVIDTFSFGSQLYGLAESLEFESLGFEYDETIGSVTPANCIELYEKWSEEEGVDGYLTYDSYLYKCLPGVIEECISNDCNGFNSPEFREMLESIKSVGSASCTVDYRELEERQFEILEPLIYKSTRDVSFHKDGYNIRNIGYPTFSGIPIYLLGFSPVMSVMAGSDNPEGAYEFIEFIMTKSQLYGNEEGKMLTLNSLCNKGFFTGSVPVGNGNATLGMVINNELMDCVISEENYNVLKEMSLNSLYLNKTYRDIMDIIIEETALYFNDDKSLDEVIPIIQSRVRIMLEEQ